MSRASSQPGRRTIVVVLAAVLAVAGVLAALFLEPSPERAVAMQPIGEVAGGAVTVQEELAAPEEAPASDDGTRSPSIEPAPRARSARTAAAAPPPPPAASKRTPYLTPFFGRVLDRTSGLPVAGARVAAYATGGLYEGPTSITDAGGLFSLERPEWLMLYARIEAPGYVVGFAVPDPFHRDASQPLSIELDPSAALDLVVLRADGEALVDAVVIARPPPLDLVQRALVGGERLTVRNEPELVDLTDGRGRARIERLPSNARVRVEIARGRLGQPLDARTIVLAPGEVRAFEWRLGAPSALRCLVLDADGKPLDSARVRAQRIADATAAPGRAVSRRDLRVDGGSGPAGPSARAVLDAKTDRDGRVRFDGLAPGRYSVTAQRAQAPSREALELDESEEGPIRPIRARAAPMRDTIERVVEIGADATEVDVEMRFDASLTIRGRVVSWSSLDVAGVGVRATNALDGRSEDCVTGASGDFELLDLPGGVWSVVALPGIAHSGSAPALVDVSAYAVELEIRPALHPRLRIVEARTGSTRSGRVVGFSADGSAVLDARIEAAKPLESLALAPGRYVFVARTDDGLAGVLHVDLEVGPRAEPFDVEVDRSARLVLRYHGPADSADVFVSNGVGLVARESVRCARSSELLLPSGTYQAWIVSDDTTALDSRWVTLAAGGEVRVDFGESTPR